MLNIFGLVKMINTNEDQFIQKDEVQDFIKKQKSPSVFNEYLQSINDQVDVWEFQEQMAQIAWETKEKTGKEATIEFKKKKYDKEYEKCSLEAINEMRDEAYRLYGYKAANKNAFNQLFASLLKESIKEGSMDMVFIKLRDLEITQPISEEYIRESKAFNITLPQGVTLSREIDWSNSRELFKYLTFDETTFANTPKENLPEGYDPQQVFDNGKSIGLGIAEVHDMGYTGEGVSYAIIDSGVEPHEDIHFKEYRVSDYANKEYINHFHGSAVSYIAQEIAPQADLYYYAQHNGGDMNAVVLDNLKAILEKNKTLPDNQKIRFVSMSMPLYGGEEAKQVAAELEAHGVWIFYSGCPEDNQFGYLGKVDPMASSDDFDNYLIECGANVNIMPNGERVVNKREGRYFYVNSGDRTVPDPSSPTAYRHDSRASQSWSIPTIAGYYSLACQADPTMTKERFMRLADETAQVKQSTMPIVQCVGDPNNEEDWVVVGRTEETTDMKILDIKALLQAIENEKAQSAE